MCSNSIYWFYSLQNLAFSKAFVGKTVIVSEAFAANYNNRQSSNNLKGALSGLIQFLATESPLKMMNNAFYFISKAHFVLKIFKFLS